MADQRKLKTNPRGEILELEENKIDVTQLEYIAAGACFLGSGGGGGISSAMKYIKHFRKNSGSYYEDAKFVKTCNLGALKKRKFGAVAAYVGAPSAGGTPKTPTAAVKAFEMLEKKHKTERPNEELEYVIPIEIGAVNTIVPCLVAAKLGKTVVNATGSFRSVPKLSQLNFGNTPAFPAAMVTQSVPGQRTLSVQMDDIPSEYPYPHSSSEADVAEDLIRGVVKSPVFGGSAGMALWSQSGSRIRDNLCKTADYLSIAYKTGQLLERAATASQVRKSLNDCLQMNAEVLFERARIIRVRSQNPGGFDVGEIVFSNENGEFCAVQYVNESLVAWSGSCSKPLCVAPDSIAYFREEADGLRASGKVFSNDDLVDTNGHLKKGVEGMTFSLLRIPAPNYAWDPKLNVYSGFQEILGNLPNRGFLTDPSLRGRRRI